MSGDGDYDVIFVPNRIDSPVIISSDEDNDGDDEIDKEDASDANAMEVNEDDENSTINPNNCTTIYVTIESTEVSIFHKSILCVTK